MKEELEKVYGPLIKEDENFYYFQGFGEHGATIPKNAFFDLQPERLSEKTSVGYKMKPTGEAIV